MNGVWKVKEKFENLSISILGRGNTVFQNKVVKSLSLVRKKLSVIRSDKKNVPTEDRPQMLLF